MSEVDASPLVVADNTRALARVLPLNSYAAMRTRAEPEVRDAGRLCVVQGASRAARVASLDQCSGRAHSQVRRIHRRHEPQGFPAASFDPERKFRGSKTSRRARRSVLNPSHHHEFVPVNVNPEQRAALVYVQFSCRGCGGHTARNGVIFHKAGESTETHPRPLHAIYRACAPMGGQSELPSSDRHHHASHAPQIPQFLTRSKTARSLGG